MQIAMIEDKIVPLEQLEQIYLDRAAFFGDGVYEVIRSYNGKIFAFQEHLNRLSENLSAIKITAINIDQIHSRIERAFKAADIPNAKIYLHISRGSAIRTHTWNPDIKPNCFLSVTEIEEDEEEKAKGIAVSTHPDWRWKKCNIKSLNLLANVLARQDAYEKGANEAILVDDKGFITEGAASTFFAVFGKKLQTTPLTANVLPSITRRYVIKAAKKIGMEIIEKSFTPEKAIKADELFISVTTKDIVPVVKFDEKIIADGKPGQCTNELIRQFAEFTI